MHNPFRFPIYSFSAFLIVLTLSISIVRQDKSKIRLYYVDGCPTCEFVKAFIQSNKLERKFFFKEVSSDYRNYAELVLIARKFKIDTLRVPMAYDPRKDSLYKDVDIMKLCIKLFKEEKKNEKKS